MNKSATRWKWNEWKFFARNKKEIREIDGRKKKSFSNLLVFRLKKIVRRKLADNVSHVFHIFIASFAAQKTEEKNFYLSHVHLNKLTDKEKCLYTPIARIK